MLAFKVWRIQTLKQINNFLSINTQWKSKSKLGSEPQVAQNTILRLWIELTKSAQNTILRFRWKLTWFEEIFEEYKQINPPVIWYWGIFEFPTLLSTSEGLQFCF